MSTSDLAPVLIGAVSVFAGAVIGQVNGIAKIISKSRRRKQQDDERRAEIREAKLRPLYENLLESVNHMRINMTGLKDAHARAGQDSPVFGGLAEAFGGHVDKLLSATITVKIDGSVEAKNIAGTITDFLQELTEKVRSTPPGIQELLSDGITTLGKAEADLIEVARKDIGAGRLT